MNEVDGINGPKIIYEVEMLSGINWQDFEWDIRAKFRVGQE